MSKYTPGPWRTDPDLGHEQVLGPDGIIVADCSIFAMVKNGSTPERNRANARLIAAAPELLEKLINITNRFEKCLIHSGTDKEYAEIAVAEARAAIAKATRKECD